MTRSQALLGRCTLMNTGRWLRAKSIMVWLVDVASLEGQESVAIADVPVSPLAQSRTPGWEVTGGLLTDRFPLSFLSVDLGSVVCHHHRDQFFVSHLGLFHTASIGPPEGESDHRCDSLGTGHQDRFLTELLLISLCYLFTSHFDSNICIVVDDGENERAFGFTFPIALAFRERETIQTVCNFIGDKAFEH